VAFCEGVLQRPDLAQDERFSSNSRRVANRDALKAIILEIFSALTAKEVVQRLDAVKIANARVNDMHAVWAHPQLQARGRWTEVPTPSGAIPALLPPGTNNAYAPRMDGVPGLGEHTQAILAELGWSDDAIEDLRRKGAI